MTLSEVRTLVRQGENEFIEFKQKANYPEKILKEVVAFANTKGGHLLIGVNDDGNITGLKNADEEAYALSTALKKYCRPRIPFENYLISISKKRSLLYYYIHESNKKPHFVLSDIIDKKKGFAYVRVRDMSIKASPETREILRRSRKFKDIKFHFGEKEKILMQYLQEYQSITLNKFKSIANLNRYQASRTLVLLTLANVLEQVPSEKEDKYLLKSVG